MMKRVSWMTMICVLCFFFGLALSAAADTEIFEKRYDVESGTSLELKNKNGKVKISQWDEPQVRVFAKKKAKFGGKLSKVRIDVHIGETLRVETVYLSKNPRVSVDYDIQVPAGVLIASVENSNGTIRLENTEGESRVTTSNGEIVVRDVTGNILTKTSNGAIDIKGVAGDVVAETSNGSIDVSSVEGFVSGETSNGKIVVKKVVGLRDLKSSNGKIEVEIPANFDEKILLKNSNGAIKLVLPPDLNAELKLKTSNGKINLHEIEVITREFSRDSLKGRIGDGGALLEVKTSNGTIDLYPLR